MSRLWAAGAAIVVCLALGGLPAVAQDAEAVPATGEVLYEITVPAVAIPVGLEKMPVDEWTLAPGTDAVVALGNEAIRGRGCLVRAGTLTVTPATNALLWRTADAVGGPPGIAWAGEPLALEAGDVFLLPAVLDEKVDPSAEVGLANPGPDDAVVFCFHMHQPGGQFSGWPEGISGTPDVTHYERADMQATEAGDSVFRLTRIEAPVGAILERPDDAAYAFYVVTQGGIKSAAGGPTWSKGLGMVLSALTEPPLQAVAVGDEPAEVLELAVIPSTWATVPEATPQA
jgi:hypothetical protein